MTSALTGRSRSAGLLALLLAACASEPGPAPAPVDADSPDDAATSVDAGSRDDAVTSFDAPAADAPTIDAPRAPLDAPTDARPDASADASTADASTADDPCRGGRPIDLLPLSTAPDSSGVDADNRGVFVESLFAAPCVPRVGHVRAFRYALRSGSARLEVTVRGARGAALAFDAVAWVLDRCATTAASLACVASDRRQPAVVTTVGRVARGVEVFVLVGGDLGGAPSGEYVVAVREVDPRGVAGDRCADRPCADGLRCASGVCQARAAAGAPCEPGDATYCIEGTSCVFDDTRARRCTPPGSLLAPCRTAAGSTPCEAGLQCVGGVCLREVTAGGDCTPLGRFCAAGSNCLGTSAARRCVVDGARGAVCRRGDGVAPCDGTDVCVADRCVPVVGASEACAPYDGSNGCPDGLGCSRARVCVPGLAEGAVCTSENPCLTGLDCLGSGLVFTDPQRCRRRGALGGRCHTEGVACDGALGCLEETCHTVIPVGQPCQRLLFHDLCAPGAYCVPDPTQAATFACLADGAFAGRCRIGGESACDAGLTCAGYQCVRYRAIGEVCEASDTYNPCPPASRCAGPAGSLRCLADGTLGGRCRQGTLQPLCDPGSGCTNPTDRANGVCVPSRAPGESCDPDARANVCVDNGVCAPRGGAYVCLTNGSPGGRCRTITATVTACVTGSCGVTYLCPVAAGDEGGRCRSTTPACGAGLACNNTPPSPSCRPALADGQPCDVFGYRNACTPPAVCSTAPGTGAFACRRP